MTVQSEQMTHDQQTKVEMPFKIPHNKRDTEDFYDAVINDKWIFGVCWGPQRSGKSTVALWQAYFLWRRLDPRLTEEELWERVYQCIVFSLTELLYKLKNKEIPRVWDKKKLHYRIPIIVWDDFGVHSNKAITQHQQAWDEFKGAFDAFGTKLSILLLTMTTPDEPTAQIGQKYTHEIWVYDRGYYKYDKCHWKQNYKGWKARHSKDWQQVLTFIEIPMHRYRPYDELRMTLADEAIVRVEDAMSLNIDRVLERTSKHEIKLLALIYKHTQENLRDIAYTTIREHMPNHFSDAIKRCKAHQYIVVERRGTNSYYNITDFGVDVLKEHQNQKAELD